MEHPYHHSENDIGSHCDAVERDVLRMRSPRAQNPGDKVCHHQRQQTGLRNPVNITASLIGLFYDNVYSTTYRQTILGFAFRLLRKLRYISIILGLGSLPKIP